MIQMKCCLISDVERRKGSDSVKSIKSYENSAEFFSFDQNIFKICWVGGCSMVKMEGKVLKN